MNPLPYVCWTVFALSCFVFTSWSAPITYPNQVYIFSEGTFSAVPGAFNVKAVAAEGNMVLAVTQNGRVVISGLPEHWAQEGLWERITNAVAVGLNHTMGAALTADGRVIEFGGGKFQPPGLTNVIAIDVAGQSNDDDLDYILAVSSDGRVVTWGRYEDWFPPSAEIPGVVTAAGGWNHIVALKSDGTVVQWDMDNAPTIVAGLSNVVAVAAGGEHSLALKADGTVVTWGQNFFGQLNLPAGLSNVVAIAASEHQSLALKRDGTLVAWGQGYTGEDVTPPANLSNVLAIASGGTRNVAIGALPVPPPITYPNQAYLFYGETVYPIPGFTNIKALAVEGDSVIGITRDGVVIGNGGIPLGQVNNAVDVGLSYVQSAALTREGTVVEFGGPSPLWPPPPGLTNVIAFDVFGQFADDDLDAKVAVTSDGRVAVWGQGAFFPPSEGLTGVVAAFGGWAHVVALKGDGTVVMWGDNSSGQLDVPAGLSNVVAVTAGGMHSVALKADGTVVAWGENLGGQLNVPPGLSNVVAISASEYQTLALKRDGTLAAWGSSYYEPTITPPASLTNVLAIDTSGHGNVALVGLPPQRPTLGITANAPTSGQLTISLSGEPNKVYAIETSTDLLTWHFLQHVTNETGTASFEVGNTNANQQFFRAK